ncbi:CD209 antigen-like protein C [Paramisgurnus dabryanus]|uniref:CD209 antigen-like protein C n=1 Tax=Paramisgurnus dabryanus TaxID=90735 RepID=UPI0031F3C97D
MAKNTSGDRNYSGMKAINRDAEEKNVYANTDNINIHNLCRGTEETTRIQTSQNTESETMRMRCYRSVSVCLVLLCVLLLTAVIVLCVLINTNNHQFNNKNKNITEEKDQLLTKYTKLWTHLHEGWIYSHFSLYFISSEKKSWTESRRYCRERGADLIIIKNKEEHDFIKNITDGDRFWIGLSDSDKEGRWKWVDGSLLNSSFWGPGEPNSYGGDEDCAEYRSSWWNDIPCYDILIWICETES